LKKIFLILILINLEALAFNSLSLKLPTINLQEKYEGAKKFIKDRSAKASSAVKEVAGSIYDSAKSKIQNLITQASRLISSFGANISNLIYQFQTNISLFRSNTLIELNCETCETVKKEELLTQRFQNVKEHQQKLGRSNKPLTIAICASGGGYRAMTSTLGFVKGLEQIGVLDSILYMAGLSGSTWATVRWIEDDQNQLASIIEEVKSKITNNSKVAGKYLLRGLNDSEFKTYAANLLIKLAYNQPRSKIIEYYGSSVATNIFQPSYKILEKRLSEQKNNLSSGNKPLPIYTSIVVSPDLSVFKIDGELLVADNLSLNTYKWVEYTPWYVGLPELKGSYFSTEFFGSRFDSEFRPQKSVEPSLALLIGIFGSAFSASLNYLYKDLPDRLRLQFESVEAGLVAKALLETNPVTNARVAVADVNNFINIKKHKDDQDPIIRELCKHKTLKLADAGLEFNLPFPPLLHRRVDLILVCDATSSQLGQEGISLLEANDYAIKHQLPFPNYILDPTNAENKLIFTKENLAKMIQILNREPTKYQCLVLEEDNKPTIIYFPFVGQIGDQTAQACLQADCGTLNFGYSATAFDNLIEFMNSKIINSADIIKDKIITKQVGAY
jgi:hypothetical protein